MEKPWIARNAHRVGSRRACAMIAPESMPIDVAARVLENTNLGGGYFLTTFEAPGIAENARPGQFVMVGTIEPSELLLRRPFSVCLRRGPDAAALLYRST